VQAGAIGRLLVPCTTVDRQEFAVTVGDMEQPPRRTADFVYYFVAVD